ncbi:hypothetical protein SAMN05192553_104228 [Cyclobacterium xiamenense]|uniref:Uncharacterized protein n=1 Tax=Cyclobacterium xiamenense TaxID=1297121 RepID=A0A1H6Z4Q5_9BACT|nr:hypothetical protein [Cyclobacterium xiamenense]SEJ48543.1 hypothetical protein SAMN05192553_104228 [Cyclobacterium xiamenense]
MTDDEFDLLDELYFLQSYDYLKNKLGWEDERLLVTLDLLLQKAWIKCYSGPEEEIFTPPALKENGNELYYLASKQGLLRHNTR